jgi:hypothetical protein
LRGDICLPDLLVAEAVTGYSHAKADDFRLGGSRNLHGNDCAYGFRDIVGWQPDRGSGGCFRMLGAADDGNTAVRRRSKKYCIQKSEFGILNAE